MKKVSFDFDGTLSRIDVQNYAKSIIDKAELWITTSRFEDVSRYDFNATHADLYDIAERVGIPKDRIIFTNMTEKVYILDGRAFVWHLDDDRFELKLLQEGPANGIICPIGISVNGNFVPKCDRLL
jgi:hypothetical protein